MQSATAERAALRGWWEPLHRLAAAVQAAGANAVSCAGRSNACGVLCLFAAVGFVIFACWDVLPPEALDELSEMVWTARYAPIAFPVGYVARLPCVARVRDATGFPSGLLPAIGLLAAYLLKSEYPTVAAAIGGAAFMTGALQADYRQAAANNPLFLPPPPHAVVHAGGPELGQLHAVYQVAPVNEVAPPPPPPPLIPHGCAVPPGSLGDELGRTVVPALGAEWQRVYDMHRQRADYFAAAAPPEPHPEGECDGSCGGNCYLPLYYPPPAEGCGCGDPDCPGCCGSVVSEPQ
eukprot:TRINITY_DN7458_c0_g1_i1.p1 TRINITY_DN7458_c0_g1~~TRINITY_DN7458_c0_g1_i1.p1  ORF type:complete len:292 (+),score=39.37 TRINITY_DN7458_c0_g1_i1:77-952(+)